MQIINRIRFAMTEKTLEDRVLQLEELVSHQERLLEELNGVLIDIRNEHESLRKTVSVQVREIEAKLEGESNSFDPNEKPPHY